MSFSPEEPENIKYKGFISSSKFKSICKGRLVKDLPFIHRDTYMVKRWVTNNTLESDFRNGSLLIGISVMVDQLIRGYCMGCPDDVK